MCEFCRANVGVDNEVIFVYECEAAAVLFARWNVACCLQFLPGGWKFEISHYVVMTTTFNL